MTIYCEIVTQDKIVYKGDADIVILPGINGIMGILPNHAPLLSMLQMGIITIRKADINQFFTVAGGVAEIQPDQVTVLADMAENVEEIDIARAEAAKQRAENLLKQEPVHNTGAYMALLTALRRSNLRLNAVKRYRHRRLGH